MSSQYNEDPLPGIDWHWPDSIYSKVFSFPSRISNDDISDTSNGLISIRDDDGKAWDYLRNFQGIFVSSLFKEVEPNLHLFIEISVKTEFHNVVMRDKYYLLNICSGAHCIIEHKTSTWELGGSPVVEKSTNAPRVLRKEK